jgi:translation initiation factor 1
MKTLSHFRGVVLRDLAQLKTVAQPAPPQAAPAKPVQGARVRVGREVAGRGGKAVSVISGLPLSGEELEQLAARLKKLCGAGGAVKSANIEIQGDHRDRLVSELCRLGYQARRAGG